MFKEKKNTIVIMLSIVLVLLLIIMGEVYYFSKNNIKIPAIKTDTNNIKTPVVKKDTDKKVKVTLISDKRCGNKCNLTPVIAQLKKIPALSTIDMKILDYSDKGVKKIFEKTKLTKLPVILFSNNSIPELVQYLKPTNDNQFSLELGGTFDPTAEICGNGIDDDNNGKTDCEDSACSKTLACAPKVDKPKAELFVMSYCPFGTQAEKGYLDVMKKLGKVADIKIKYVNYVMHGEKEGEQNIVQNCIQKEQNDKFYNYLKCFLKEGKNEECLKSEKIDTNKLNTCINKTKKEINYTENLSKKVGNYPIFTLYDDLNKKYGVQGSPTFVLNGIKIDNVGRSAKAYADIICNSFKEKPEECKQNFINTTYDPNFGFTSNGKAVQGGCGQ